MKRSLEITVDYKTRNRALEVIELAGIEVAESRDNFIQVRKTTPTEIRRLLKGIPIRSIGEGFRR